MIPLNVLGRDCWLIPFGPNTADTVTVKARVDVDAARGQTGRASRRPQALLLRHELSWLSLLKAADYMAARAVTLSGESVPVVAPFWPAARAVADAALMTSGATLAWKRDWSAYAVNPVSLAGYDFFAPLLMGYLAQPPRLESRTSDHVLAEWVLQENAPAAAALVPPTSVDTTLATPDGFAVPLFPFTPEGAVPPLVGLPDISVARERFGPGREATEVHYPQAPETSLQPAYKFKSAAAAIALLGWWQRRAGSAGPCWVAGTQKIADLTGDLAAGVSSIVTAAAAAVEPGDTLALLTTGQAPEFVRIDAVDGITLDLGGPTAAAHARAWTTLAPAILARHADEVLTLNFRRGGADWIADCALAFREVAAEYAATDGEVRGETLGRLAPWAWLFRIDLDYSGVAETWHLTNWESGATTSDDQDWEYRDCSFDRISQSTDLEDDACTFRVRWWSGCPWENWLPGRLAATGRLTILRAPVSSDGVVGAPEAVWSGILSTPEREGPLLTVKVLGANTLFARRAPAQTMTPTCYKRLYGARCGLNMDDWKFVGEVMAAAGQSLTIGSIVRENTDPLPDGFGFKDWFALGWAEFDGRRSGILSSTVLASGEITLTLVRPLDCEVGESIVAVPGCDKQRATCWNYDAEREEPVGTRGKFNNYQAFGGFFDIPAVSPNLVIPNTRKTPAKK